MSDVVGGFLEVGLDEHGQVVINHPDLKPDENGVGHIVFSPNQARNLALLLVKHASRADFERHHKIAVVDMANAPPVDRSARVLVSGQPVPEALCAKPIGVSDDDPRWDDHDEDCDDCDLCRDRVPIILFRGEGKAMQQAQFHNRCFEQLVVLDKQAGQSA